MCEVDDTAIIERKKLEIV